MASTDSINETIFGRKVMVTGYKIYYFRPFMYDEGSWYFILRGRFEDESSFNFRVNETFKNIMLLGYHHYAQCEYNWDCKYDLQSRKCCYLK